MAHLSTTNKSSNGLIGSTVNIGYGSAIPPATPLTVGTVYPAGNGSAGQIYTTNGTSGTWSNPNQLGDNVLVAKNNPPSLEVNGRMVINGVDLEERLNTIERVLTIPERDVKLEKKHPKLKKLYEEYIQALAKYRTFEAIKGED